VEGLVYPILEISVLETLRFSALLLPLSLAIILSRIMDEQSDLARQFFMGD
jgi:hypothetical protein